MAAFSLESIFVSSIVSTMAELLVLKRSASDTLRNMRSAHPFSQLNLRCLFHALLPTFDLAVFLPRFAAWACELFDTIVPFQFVSSSDKAGHLTPRVF